MLSSDLAPIVLFVYNRPINTGKTLESLMNNDFANQSNLIIYSDGPKMNSSEEEVEKIFEVRKVIRSRQWCKQVNIIESEFNKGLAQSIIEGVTEAINKYGKIIVLEDDLIVSPGFLGFMNRALTLYEDKLGVMHISGHSFPLLKKKDNIYFLRYVSSWGWATWADRWKYFEPDAATLFKKLERQNINWRDFNSGYGDSFKTQLLANVNCQANTWAIKWHSSVYLNNGLTLFPGISLVRNIGFDGSGSHLNNLNAILSIQNVDSKNDFIFLEPVFSNKAYKRLIFFYNKNILLKKLMNRLSHKLFGRF